METQRKAQNVSAASGVMSGIAGRLDQSVGYLNDTIPEVAEEALRERLVVMRDQLSDVLETVNEMQIEAQALARIFWDNWAQESAE